MNKGPMKSIALILAALMLCGSFVSCSEKSQNETEKQASTADTAANANETAPEEEIPDDAAETLDIPFNKYDGQSFCSLNGDNVTYNWRELTVEEITGEAVNDAFYNRNLAVEELLEVKITSVVNATGGNTNAFRNSVNSNDGAYDVAFMNFGDSSGVASGGYCLDINTLPYIDLEKSWWSRDSVEQLKLLGKNYLVASDITIGDKECMWVLYFDKEYFVDFQLDDPYELVAEGEWTFDVFYDMLQVGLLDLDGNGIYNMNDRYGLLTHSENYAGMWTSAGESLITLDSDYMPEIVWNSERFNSVWEKIAKIMGDPAVYGNDVGFITSGLKEGKALFATEVVAFIRAYRDNEREFGILPMPKYDVNQDRYYTYVAANSDLMVVSKALRDEAFAGEVLEALAAKGKEIIMPAYYEVSLKGKGARDEQSSASLDIIFANRMYDLSLVFGWGGVVNGLKSPNVNLASTFAKYEKILDKTISKTIDAMSDD